jgi:hypothetical protein
MANTAAQRAQAAAKREAEAQKAAAQKAARDAEVWRQRELSRPTDPNNDYTWQGPVIGKGGNVIKKAGWTATPRALAPLAPTFEQQFPGVNRVAEFTPLELEAQRAQVDLARSAPAVVQDFRDLYRQQNEQLQPTYSLLDRLMTPDAMSGRLAPQSQALIDQVLGDKTLDQQNAWLNQFMTPEAMAGRPGEQSQRIIDQILANTEGNRLRENLYNTYLTPAALAGSPTQQTQGVINQILANEEGKKLNDYLQERFMSENALDVSNNKVWQNAANAATQPMQAQFMEEILPQLRAQGIESGGLGGTRLALAGGLATDKLAQSMLNARSNIFAQAQQQALQQAMQGAGLVQQGNEAQAARQQAIASLLEQLRADAQARGLQAGGLIQQGNDTQAARQQAITGLLEQLRADAKTRGLTASGLIGSNTQFRQGMQSDMSRFIQQQQDAARNMGLAAAQARAQLAGGQFAAGNNTIANILNTQNMANQAIAGVGESQRNMNQANINSVLERLNSQRAVGDQAFNNYLAQIMSGNFGQTSTTTQRMPGQQNNIIRNALGGATTGAGLGSMIMPGIGTAIGAGFGALAGGFM